MFLKVVDAGFAGTGCPVLLKFGRIGFIKNSREHLLVLKLTCSICGALVTAFVLFHFEIGTSRQISAETIKPHLRLRLSYRNGKDLLQDEVVGRSPVPTYRSKVPRVRNTSNPECGLRSCLGPTLHTSVMRICHIRNRHSNLPTPDISEQSTEEEGNQKRSVTLSSQETMNPNSGIYLVTSHLHHAPFVSRSARETYNTLGPH